jgi:hypothetical protein
LLERPRPISRVVSLGSDIHCRSDDQHLGPSVNAVPRYLILSVPLLLDLLFVLWTALVSPYSKYGDTWAIMPVLIAFGTIVLWHIGLVAVLRGERLFMIGYTIVHLPLSFYGMVWMLLKISKDAL